MKKKNLKPMIISALLAIGFGATSVGTSFALFTDHADTKIDVTAGIVDIETKIELVSYSSSVEGGTVTDLTNKNTHTNELTGSNFSLNGKTVTIDRMVPGDKLVVKVTNTNKSNVITQTRFVANHATLNNKKDLFPALDIDMEAKKANNDPIAYPMKWAVTPAAQNLTDGEVINTILVSIEFTDTDNGVINFNSADNAYQDAACTITFSEEAVQGNAALDPIEVINAYLVSEDMQGRGNNTMHDALEDVAALGYEVAVLDGYVWGMNEDQFVLASGVSANKNEYFKMVTTAAQADGFSIYAANGWATADVDVQGIGFDAGDASGISSVTYTGLGQEDARTNLIRTNSLNTSVTVNAPYDVVKHYGDAASVNVVAVAGNSYHEYGRVAFFEVANGRVALEKTATVDNMHFTATNGDFNDITVAYDQAVTLPKFSRDPVASIPESGKLVVELQNSTDKSEAESDYIWLYQQGLVEQIRISDNGTNAGNVKATDSSVSQETNKAANDLSNNLKDGASTPTQEQLDTGTVPAADIEEGGLDTEGKDAAKQEAISKYTVAINATTGVKYTDPAEAISNIKKGETVNIVKDCALTTAATIYSAVTSNYTANINVNENVVFTFKDDGQITFDVTSSSCRVALGGKGTIRIQNDKVAFAHGTNGQLNEVLTVNNVSVIGGKFSNCKVRFESGHFDTQIIGLVNTQVAGWSDIAGGTYTFACGSLSELNALSRVGKKVQLNNAETMYEVVDYIPSDAIFMVTPDEVPGEESPRLARFLDESNLGLLEANRANNGYVEGYYTLTLLKDIERTESIDVNGRYVNIDLNNHSIKVTNPTVRYIFGMGNINRIGYTVSNGTLLYDDGYDFDSGLEGDVFQGNSYSTCEPVQLNNVEISPNLIGGTLLNYDLNGKHIVYNKDDETASLTSEIPSDYGVMFEDNTNGNKAYFLGNNVFSLFSTSKPMYTRMYSFANTFTHYAITHINAAQESEMFLLGGKTFYPVIEKDVGTLNFRTASAQFLTYFDSNNTQIKKNKPTLALTSDDYSSRIGQFTKMTATTK